ncbi:MAG TPA: DUF5993 family protein [Pirellulales bacterium]
MDTIVFSLILGTFASLFADRRWLVVGLFLLTVGAALALFWAHIIDPIHLNF